MNDKYIEYKVRNNLGRITGIYVNTALFWKLYIHHNAEYIRKQRANYFFSLNNIITVFVSPPNNSIKIILEEFQFFADWLQLRHLNDPK